ncbi:hypothetical protein SLEP1_g59877 [Rubroshorea leprosula]|uniref:Uncharacterized protein n=1 Tax=Rubroshorea leprosula TaxID=152421 RepID=A0AAV5MW65_9ROSI|nr:hypothetical protein SLEP1_g59877 [Rubroshorea leprosula]
MPFFPFYFLGGPYFFNGQLTAMAYEEERRADRGYKSTGVGGRKGGESRGMMKKA